MAVTPVAGQLDLKKVEKRWVPRKLRWPIRWSRSVRGIPGWGDKPTGAEKTSANDYDAPAQEFATIYVSGGKRGLVSNWRQAIWRRSSMPNLLISPPRLSIVPDANIRHFRITASHLTFRFINTHIQRRAFLDIPFSTSASIKPVFT